jgi:hypothetical protein
MLPGHPTLRQECCCLQSGHGRCCSRRRRHAATPLPAGKLLTDEQVIVDDQNILQPAR